MKQLTISVLSLLLVSLLWQPNVSAQTVQGAVTGTVADATGAVIPNAQVTLTNERTGVAQKAVTDSAGSYRFPLVPPGSYTLEVKAPGFTTRDIKNVLVEASQSVPLNVTLSVSSATETVEVTAQVTAVQTATADLATTVNRTTIENTPLISRNVFDLAFVAPQVTQGMNLGPAAGGARESGTAYLLNGADNNDNFSEGAFNITPPLESVGEFTILTNSMSAQYGRGAGAIVSALQKSGTNNIHGSLYEFNRNRSLNASDFFQNRQGSPKPHYVRNQFGGEVDGPVIKDRTFFSFAYDQVALHTGADLDVQVPTPSELSAIKSGAGPLASFYLQKYPPLTSQSLCPDQAKNAPESIGHIGCIHVFNPRTFPTRTYYGRMDHNFSGNDRLSFTANVYRQAQNNLYGGGHPFASQPISSVDNEHYHNLSLVETHLFGPRVINEFTVAHNRHFSNFLEGDGKFTDPEIVIDGENYGGLGFGFGAYEGGLVQGFTQDRWQFQDNLGLTLGKHFVKLGGGWQYGILYRNWDLGKPGQFEFANTIGPTPQQADALAADGTIGGLTETAPSNFQKDFPYFMEMSIDPHTGAQANAYRHYMMKDSYLFLNDDWKVTRRLTLNLGLRWERYGAPTEAHNIIAQFTNFNCTTPQCIGAARVGPAMQMWQTRNGDLGPRVGFAWDVFGSGRTALRGGYGIYYDRIFDNVWSNGAWNPPFYGLIDFDATAGDKVFYRNPPAAGPAYVPDSLPGPAGRVSVRTMENNLKDSSVQNFFFAVEQRLGTSYLVRVNYQGSLGRHLPVLMNWNRFDGMGYNVTLTPQRPNPLYTGFNYRSNNVTSSYNALVTEVQKRLTNGLQFQFGYTWSKLMDIGSDLFTGETLTGGYSQPYYFVSNAHRNLERGPGGFDHTQSFKVNFIYQLPFLRDQHGALGKLAGGWQVSAFYQGYSGHPLEVFNGRGRFRGNARDANGIPENMAGDYNLDGVANDHPLYTGPAFGSFYSGANPADGWFKDNHKIGCGFPGAQSTNIAACNRNFGVDTPNAMFTNPPGTGVRFGSLGRNTFRGPWFNGLDAAMFKTFKITEAMNLQFRAEAINLPNHPNFDGIPMDLNSSNFGKAQILVGNAAARIFQLGGRFFF